MALLEDTPEIEPGDSYDRAQRLLNHDGRWKVGRSGFGVHASTPHLHRVYGAVLLVGC